jgi:hypothetical protein
MGEIERYAAEAEMLPLMRTNGGLRLSAEGKQLQAKLRREATDGLVRKARMIIETNIAKTAMDSVKEVDNYRKAIGGEDVVLDTALVEIEVAHLEKIRNIQRGDTF